MSDAPITSKAREQAVGAPASLVGRLRDDADAVTNLILALPRAARITDDDAHQIVHGLMHVAIEAAAGTSTSARDLMIDTMRDLVDTGRSLADSIRGVTRVYTLLATVVVGGLPEADRAEASTWLAEFASSFTGDVVAACLGRR